MNSIIRRGDIFWVNFNPARASETQKIRPALICSHKIMNEHSSRVIVAPITSNLEKIFPLEYAFHKHKTIRGKVMLDQMRVIDKSRLGSRVGNISIKQLKEIDSIIKTLFGL